MGGDALGVCTHWSDERMKDAPIIHYSHAIADRNGESIWSKESYRPSEHAPDPSLAAEEHGRDLLTLVNEYVDQRLGEERAALRPRRSRGVTRRRRGNELALQPPGSSEAMVLNVSAEAIWELCDGERSLLTIAEELARRFEVAPEQILPDIEASVRRLVDIGAVET